jgi:hypothetical protein
MPLNTGWRKGRKRFDNIFALVYPHLGGLGLVLVLWEHMVVYAGHLLGCQITIHAYYTVITYLDTGTYIIFADRIHDWDR